MRKHRIRSYAIEAQNIDEFNKKCEIALQNIPINQNSLENAYEKDISINNSNINSHGNNNDNKFEYQGFDKINDYSEEEFDEEEDINSEEALKESQSQDEKNLELLCIYLKQSISLMSKEKSSRCANIFYRYNNPIHTFSGNAIYDLNVKEIVDDIITSENDIKSNEDDNPRYNNLKEFIIQNIKGDFSLKIMIICNNDYTRNLLMKNFLSNSDEKINNKEELQIDDSDFEIRRKQIRLFNKNISLQLFDTSNLFHNNSFSKLYYKFSNGFFIFIEATNNGSKEYLENFFKDSEKYIQEKTVVIFGVNMLFENNSTIDGFNLKEFALKKNFIFIPIKIENFSFNNSIIRNILNLILIKKLDSKKEMSKENNKFEFMKNKITYNINSLSSKNIVDFYDITKMNIPDSFGYKQNYRMSHITIFDTEKKNIYLKKNHRKFSDF